MFLIWNLGSEWYVSKLEVAVNKMRQRPEKHPLLLL